MVKSTLLPPPAVKRDPSLDGRPSVMSPGYFDRLKRFGGRYQAIVGEGRTKPQDEDELMFRRAVASKPKRELPPWMRKKEDDDDENDSGR